MSIADLRIKYERQLRLFFGKPAHAVTDAEVCLFVTLREKYL